MTKIVVGVVQMRSGTSVVENISAMEILVTAAANAGATYVQTPEMTGLVQKSRKPFFELVRTQEDDLVFAAASELAKKLSITLHVGSTPVLVADGRAANRAAVFAPSGDLVATYDKIHMFDVDLDNGESWRESAVYQPGKSGVIVAHGSSKIGLGICYDCRFPELFTAYGRAGVDILTSPACFTRQTGKAHWHTLLRSRAIENGAFLIAAAQGGDMADGRETFGHSLVVNPWGEVIAEVDNEEPGFVVVELDLTEVGDARLKIPNLINYRPFEMNEVGGVFS